MTETLRTESWEDRVLVADVWLTMAEERETETLETLLLVAALSTEVEVAAAWLETKTTLLLTVLMLVLREMERETAAEEVAADAEALTAEIWEDKVLVADVWLTMAEEREAETLETLLLVAAMRTEDEVAAATEDTEDRELDSALTLELVAAEVTEALMPDSKVDTVVTVDWVARVASVLEREEDSALTVEVVAAEATPVEAEEARVETEDRVAEREETEDEVA
jgi:hypothetical protein